MSNQQPADRLLPGGRWPVTNPADRLDELGNMVGGHLIPGVLFDELYEIAVRHRTEVERLRGRSTDRQTAEFHQMHGRMVEIHEVNRLRSLLARLEWAGTEWAGDEPRERTCPACDAAKLGDGVQQPETHGLTCWLAAELSGAERNHE